MNARAPAPYTQNPHRPPRALAKRGSQFFLSCSLLLMLLSTKVVAAAADLTVIATGFPNAAGQAVAKLFAPGDVVLQRGRQELSAAITDGRACLTFANLPPGDYAVVVFHDSNHNGVLDHHAWGLPSEALGFSNGFVLSLTSGWPRFDKLRFTHGSATQSILVPLQ